DCTARRIRRTARTRAAFPEIFPPATLASSVSSSVRPDARIKRDQRHVRHQRAPDQKQGRKHHRPYHHVKIPPHDGLEHERPEPRPTCNHFHQQRSTQQSCKRHSKE